MPIASIDDSKIITKYYNKSVIGCSISCLFIATMLSLIYIMVIKWEFE